MRKTIYITIFMLITSSLPGQGIYNNGAYVVSQSGSYWVFDNGNFTLKSESATNLATMANLKIESDASLTLTSQSYLTVTGTLTNNAGTGGLVVKSTGAAKTGSLLHNTAGVAATVERFMAAGTSIATDHVYHIVSAPVSGQAVTLFTGNPDIFGFFRYDEASNYWINSNSTSPPFETNFVVGRGYMANFRTNQTPSFAGTLQNGTIGFNAPGIQEFTFTPGSTGWNLAGNPYPSAIDWDSPSGWTKTNVDGAIYHRESGNWVSYSGGVPSGGNIIPVGQGVFVHANAANPGLVMTNAVRVHSSQAYHKGTETLQNLLDIAAAGNDQTDHAYIHFVPEATPDFDSQYDAYKMFSDNDYYPQVYTLTPENTELSIDKRVLPEKNTSIPVCFKAGQNGNYTLTFTGFGSFAPNTKFTLEDKLLNNFTDLRQQPSVQFSYTTSHDPQRFILHFEGLVGIGEPEQDQQISIFSYGNDLYIDNHEHTGAATVEVFNLIGQRIYGKTCSLSGLLTIPLQGVQGFYIVRVTGKDFAASRKVYLH